MNQTTDIRSQTYRAMIVGLDEVLELIRREDYDSALSSIEAMGDAIRMGRLVTFISENVHSCTRDMNQMTDMHQGGHNMYAEERVCDCAGCWDCSGYVKGCTCDIDWDELTERRLDAH